ncbi:MAG: TIR domain-containing protein [Novosphingobium sp.]
MTAPDDSILSANRAPSVFLSYARADQKRALPVIKAFEQAGMRVWWDGLLEGGDTFLPTTEAALESADAVVVLWSRTSVESNWVRDEATRGRERGCLVPLSLDGSHAPLGFRQFQAINLSKWRGKADAPEMQSAIRAVTTLAGHPNPLSSNAVGPSRRGVLIGAGSAAVAVASGIVVWRTLVPGAAKATENTIAVIPFSNLGDESQSYFSAGLSEELRATLSRNRTLRIAAPTSSAEFRGKEEDILTIAKRLGVAHVLRGSVRQGSDLIRVSVELVNGKDAEVDWNTQLDRKPSEVLVLQTEIAAIVGKELEKQISAKAIAEGRSGDLAQLGGTRNAKAFDAYLRGKALVESSESEATDRAALARFDEALTIDPGYASALAARSKILAVIANETASVADLRLFYDRSVESAQAAVRQADRLAEAHSALGYALYNGRLDPKAARGPYDRSRELGTGDADVLRTYALYAAFTKQAGDAAEAIESSLSLDPLNASAFRAAGYVAYAGRNYAATIARMEEALKLNPKLSAAHSAIGSAQYLSGQTEAAAKSFAAESLAIFRLPGEAILLRKIGDVAGAQAAFDLLDKDYGKTANYQLAQVLAQWGQRDRALDRLDAAARARDSGLLLAATDPLLDPVRGDRRFADLLSRMGLA